ncbi:SDR family oxidoreductase [bacterium]|nr:SDR family oxidoreductase [bacterium]MCI0604794.1 SDR family oxidoreductase [bacterium]
MNTGFGDNDWAVILGASSGFGEATALELAKSGLHICGIHLDRRSTLPHVQEIVQAIESSGRKALFINMNAADEEKRREAIGNLKAQAGDGFVRVLLHSLAFGTLKPMITATDEEQINQSQMNMTLDVMAHSLIYWTQDLNRNGLIRNGSRIFAMTSLGSQLATKSYGAVSAAKSALESHVRQLALELSSSGATVNAIRAGVTNTPSLQKIPGHEKLIEAALKKNPAGRLTTPEDVAKTIAVLSHPNTYWMTGNTINVDGGEMIVGTK